MTGQVKKGYARPLDIKHGRVDMSHGGGGRAMVQLITDLFAKHLANEYLAQGNDGTKEYKQAISQWMKKRFGVEVNPDKEITSLIGSKEGLHHTIMAFVDKGDINIIPDPAYPVYRTSTILAGGEPYYMPLTPENNFIPDLEAIPEAVLKKAKLLMLNYPGNPTAGIADLAFFEKAVAFCKKHNIPSLNDAAADITPFEAFQKLTKAGFDLLIFSGGKGLRGP